jgi:ABC-type phosphate transport system auxiliary subunit
MTERKQIPAKLVQRINTVTNKRARFVLDSIVKNGSVSTTQLKEAGYDHPPRAARDAVELGFALARVKAKRDDG